MRIGKLTVERGNEDSERSKNSPSERETEGNPKIILQIKL